MECWWFLGKTCAVCEKRPERPGTLYTLLVECENIVNFRPLAHLPVTPDETEPLTPNHFLLGCSNSTQTPGPFNLHLKKTPLFSAKLKKKCFGVDLQSPWQPDVWFLFVKRINLDQNGKGTHSQIFCWERWISKTEINTANGLLHRLVSKLTVLDVENVGELDIMGSIHGGGDVDDADKIVQ
ncbi:hypothetical protein CVS40_11860 [Lucilia cuprina]|nr:hypothetical protein CVS40_11860 [Lucilia cuprina]